MNPTFRFRQLLTLLALTAYCSAQDDWHQAELCRDGACNDCPVIFSDAGPGHPVCNVYSVSEFADMYEPAPEGGLVTYWDIPQPDPGCAFIVRSPAGNDQENCGQNILSARNALCTRLVLRGTVMTQFCCGSGDCDDAGAGLPRRDPQTGETTFSAAGASGLVLLDSDGQVIAPLETGDGPTQSFRITTPARESKRIRNVLKKRDCEFNPTGDVYTGTGSTQVLQANVRGPASFSEERSVSVGFSTSIEAGLDIEIFSASVSFEVSTETTRSTSITVEVPDGQTGALVWTATLQCQDGFLSGNGCSGEGQGCVGAVDGQGNFIGTTAFQIRA